MDPILAAAFGDRALRRVGGERGSEDAFYERHGGRILRRAFPAAPAVAVALAVVVLAGLFGP